ncbi:amino acid ABC transporter membrane protein 1, PAAT family [Amycolatopsis marina]|uniref:Amino acid ABC transporter membrane protein 1, PAAT family n=1 Tax=Amycolatopsis marina TaxID=490629 RepID=A0A1I1CBL0_9PSEU|nr:amino acid ABC transporter permease [Amycolatopsis marina]SFB60061.1 amino acid ABC transporter membrane protein 1, PAAT family [Amycolatopsis marina]
MNVVFEHAGEFGEGILRTLQLAGSSFAGAAVVAIVIVCCRVAPVRPLRAFGTAYVELFQNIPLLVWIILFVFGLPEIGIQFDLITTAVIAIALYQGAYYAEALRTGINTVASGQAEAARALGLGFRQSLAQVILPQALRSVIQPLGNLTIMLLMNTALAAAAGVVELAASASRVNNVESDPIVIFTAAGVAYGLLALLISTVFGVLERRLVIHR